MREGGKPSSFLLAQGLTWVQYNLLMLVSMYEPLLNLSRNIRNKADAMQFSIIATMQNSCGEPSRIDYEEAEKLFNFFCDHVEFPEDDTKKMTDCVMSLLDDFLSKKDN